MLIPLLAAMSFSAAQVQEASPGNTPDLKVRLPAGWESIPQNGVVRIDKWENKDDDLWGTKRLYRLVILPTLPLRGSLVQEFRAQWAAQIKPAAETTIVPLPMRRRLKSGLACAYDVDPDAKSKDGASYRAGLFLLAHGGKMTPIAGVFIGHASNLEREIESILESAEIPGAGKEPVPLYAAAELAGEWNTSTAAYASYVSPTGGYAGDASVAHGETFRLNADGTFKASAAGVGQGLVVRESDAGTWKLDDGWLVLEGKPVRKYILYGAGADPQAGHFLVRGMYAGQDDKMPLSNPRQPVASTWFKRKE